MELTFLRYRRTRSNSLLHAYIQARVLTSMEGSDPSIAIIGLVILIGWLLPIIIILGSSKTSGGEKLAWILLIIFVSWFAWIFYWLLAPIKKG